MTIELADGAVASSLREMLSQIDSPWAPLANGEASWTDRSNDCVADIIDRFDDCPEALRDFDHSDWVNMAECYTHQLLKRWEYQRDSVRALFDDYCEAIGATSTLEALEGESIDDPEDLAAAMVNAAMTWGARMLRDELWPDR
jgi:hypothetical protein